MIYKEIINKVSKELDLPEKVVNRAYDSYWEFIRATIKELPLKENLTEDEFLELKTNFNIPSLGKLSCTYDRMVNLKKKLNYIKIIKK